MRISFILKKLPVPAILLFALFSGIKADFPAGSVQINELLSSVDSLLLPHIRHPVLALFAAGLLVGWLIYQLIVLQVSSRRQRARSKLAELRIEGTKLRMEGIALSNTAGLDRWCAKIDAWTDQVAKAIGVIDEPDSKRFEHLGYPGQMRPHPGLVFFSPEHASSFALHIVGNSCWRNLLTNIVGRHNEKDEAAARGPVDFLGGGRAPTEDRFARASILVIREASLAPRDPNECQRRCGRVELYGVT